MSVLKSPDKMNSSVCKNEMWHSKDDIVRDLASLNDFGDPGDMEPYKMLYSIGRGSKFKAKPARAGQFVDTRTGEVIDMSDEVFSSDFCYEGKGRGSLLGGFSRSKLQLQQQLRLARPMGSGDEAIEAYYRRKQAVESSKSSSGTSDSDEFLIKNEQILNNTSFDVKNPKKAVRKLSSESNALISGLLKKCEENSEQKPITTEENFIGYVEEENGGLSINHNNKNSKIDCKESYTKRDSFSSLNYEDIFKKEEWPELKKSFSNATQKFS